MDTLKNSCNFNIANVCCSPLLFTTCLTLQHFSAHLEHLSKSSNHTDGFEQRCSYTISIEDLLFACNVPSELKRVVYTRQKTTIDFTLSPLSPILPLSPSRPLNPGGPCSPFGPLGPGEPGGPVSPRGPVLPGGPCSPTSPCSVVHIVQGVNITGWGEFKLPLHLVRGCQFCLLHLGDLLDPEDRQTDRQTEGRTNRHIQGEKQ